MNRPVIHNEVEALGLGIGGANLLIESCQFQPADLGPLSIKDPTRQRVQSRYQPGFGVSPGTLVVTSLRCATGLPARLQLGTTVVGELVQKEQNDLTGCLQCFLISRQDGLPLEAVVGVRAVDEAQDLFAAKPQPFKHLIDARRATAGQSIDGPADILQSPATTG